MSKEPRGLWVVIEDEDGNQLQTFEVPGRADENDLEDLSGYIMDGVRACRGQ